MVDGGSQTSVVLKFHQFWSAKNRIFRWCLDEQSNDIANRGPHRGGGGELEIIAPPPPNFRTVTTHYTPLTLCNFPRQILA